MTDPVLFISTLTTGHPALATCPGWTLGAKSLPPTPQSPLEKQIPLHLIQTPLKLKKRWLLISVALWPQWTKSEKHRNSKIPTQTLPQAPVQAVGPAPLPSCLPRNTGCATSASLFRWSWSWARFKLLPCTKNKTYKSPFKFILLRKRTAGHFIISY